MKNQQSTKSKGMLSRAIFAISLILALLLPLAGCGKGDGKDSAYTPMPNLIGTSYDSAEETLEALGFEVFPIKAEVKTTLSATELSEIKNEIEWLQVFKINDVISAERVDSKENPIAPDGKVFLYYSDGYYSPPKDNSADTEPVTPVEQQPVEAAAVETATAVEQPVEKVSNTSGDAEWKKFLKEYEAWVDDYIKLMKKYNANPSDTSLLSDYTDAMQKMVEWSEKADKVSDELANNPAALSEYMETLTRILGKLNAV